MDLNTVDYVPASHQSGGIQTAPAEIIVMHSMECPADDRHVTNWVRSLAAVSGGPFFAHYYCGPSVTYLVAPLGRVVPHCGNGNMVRGRWTLGIEQAGYASFSRQDWIDSHALDTSGPLVASLIAAGHGANRWLEVADLLVPGARGVTSHNNMAIAFGGSTHTDPGPDYPHDLLLANTASLPDPPKPAAPEATEMISSALNADGRLELFRVNIAGQVDHKWQSEPGRGFGTFTALTDPGPLPAPATKGLEAVTSADGRIELFAYLNDLRVFHCWQQGANGAGGWSGWLEEK